ncbi:methyl-accepting chemotaxis protein [Proteiniborus ethanoligenes]|uniref:Methyl-accepting chemotaxis protein n=1 Tax=Proteiniborus ethanoligenes TaxID=415015 RepID=A0A1H3NSP8_9FIRM|nr:methyl-accepting chemotaxis protein [Proteiniborus ethanoligenes]SDY91773.1 methyl-accepting chemotaxis protein [Proteiniborus ethanoligenes]
MIKLTIRKKLVIVFSALNILTFILGAFSVYNLAMVNNEMNTLYNMHLKGVEYIKDAQVNLVTIGQDRNNLILALGSTVKKRYSEEIQKSFQSFEDNIKSFKETVIVEEGLQTSDEILKLWEQLKPKEEKVIDLVLKDKVEDAQLQSLENLIIMDQIKVKINLLVKLKNELAQKAANESQMAYSKIRVITIIIIASNILIGIGIAFYMSRTIGTPIIRMAEATKQIAEGDLSVQSIKLKVKDEVGELANSFNAMTEGLREVIRNVVDASGQVAAFSQELSAASEETTASTEEVASTINQLAIGAGKQAQDASEVSDVVHQMAVGIQNVSSNANLVLSISLNVSKEANNGLDEAKKAVEKIYQIKEITEESAVSVRSLGDESVKIGEIVEVIKGISDQTNLLALNAAIEAARAGEQGRGFAVVAEEVRKLAEDSTASALQISSLIENIQDETNRVVKIMDITMEEVLEGVEAVSKAGSSFELIFKEINNMGREIEHINALIQQIAEGSQSVDESIENIASIAEQTAASSEEVSAASEEQASAMVEIANSAQELARLAEELQLNISGFRL